MNALARNWKAIVAILLLLAAVAVLFLLFRPAQQQFEAEQARLNTEIGIFQTQADNRRAEIEQIVRDNMKYAPLQDALPGELEKIKQSRAELYEKFPQELREEDQILYVIYLEQLLKDMEEELDNEIYFSFADFEPRRLLSDAAFGGITLAVNYVTQYDTFQRLVDYLATDERITSVRYVTMNYYEEYGLLSGSLVLYLYMVVPGDYDSHQDYTAPDVQPPEEIGKPNIFD